MCRMKPPRLPHFSKLEYLYLVATIFLIGYFNYANLTLLYLNNPEEVSCHPIFTIDGESYWRGALEMIRNGNFLFTKDTYHSPGAQIWISWVLRFFEEPTPFVIKVANFLFFLLLQLLMFFFTKRLLGWRAALFLIPCLAASSFFRVYVATIQYEVLSALVTTGILYLLSGEDLKNRPIPFLVLAALCGLLFVLRYHYFYIGAVALAFIWRLTPGRYLFLGGYLLIVFGFVLTYWSHGVRPTEVRQNSERLLRWLSPLSEGYNYPYPPVNPHVLAGFNYIVEEPKSYVAQLGRRFGYLFGLKRDMYFLPLNSTKLLSFTRDPRLDTISAIWELVFILSGLLLTFRDFRKLFYAYVLVSAAFYLPIFVIGGTPRFIMPLFPIHLFFITLTVARSLEYLTARSKLGMARVDGTGL